MLKHWPYTLLKGKAEHVILDTEDRTSGVWWDEKGGVHLHLGYLHVWFDLFYFQECIECAILCVWNSSRIT